MIAAVTSGWAQMAAGPESPVASEPNDGPPIQLMFTPPDLAGRFVLGVFDSSGSLVRRLVTDREAAAFDQGLNGYITQWDGLDDAGQPCEAGRYAARGFVVGDAVVIRGEAFHFNDWIDEVSDAAVTRVEDFELADQANLIVLFEGKTGPVLERIPLVEGGAGWSVSVPGGTGLDGLDGSSVRVRTEAGYRAYALEDGAAVAAEVQPPDAEAPPAIEGGQIIDWANGFGETRWAVMETGGVSAAVQIGADGEILRNLPPDGSGFVPVGISASPVAEVIALLETRGAEQRVRVMALESSGERDIVDGRPVSDWRIVLDRVITPNGQFGVVDGEVRADAGEGSRLPWVEIALEPNELDPDGSGLQLASAFDGQGSYLATESGLLLVRVSERKGLTGVALVPGTEPNSVRLFQGNGAVVEEFLISNLGKIAAFDCGEFELGEGGQE